MLNKNEMAQFFPMPRYLMRKNALEMILKKNNCSGKKLLEIGYGAGEIFSLYKKLKIKSWGYDFSEEAYEYTKSHINDSDVVLMQNINDIPYNKYDFVVACEVLEHIENDVEQLKEWTKYLNDTGKIIISVPAHMNRWGENDIYSGHYRRYEKEELLRKFRKANLAIDCIYTYDFPACMILDGLRDKSRGRKMKKEHFSKTKEEATKTSGIERNFSPIIRILANPVIQFPIIKFEQLFYRTFWGSACIMIASKQT